MPNNFIISPKKSVYLDTSFILCAFYESIDANQHLADESRQILSLLYMRGDNSNCYISNIVLNELYNVIERTGFREYIDKKIVSYLQITESEWKEYSKSDRDKRRAENEPNIQLSMRNIKNWRFDDKYKSEYKASVEDELLNIISDLPPGFKCISNFSNEDDIIVNFIRTKKSYKKLDSNDVNHYLLCKEHNIDGILTCDSDFKQIDDSDLEIIVIDKNFKFYG